MSTVPAGKRSWKCPECGSDVLLSKTQLNPIACEACLNKMKGGGSAAAGTGIADAAAGPLGIWQGLPETTKLAVVAVALVAGLVIGFIAGKSMASPPATPTRHTSSSTSEPKRIPREEPKPFESDEKRQTDVEEERPEAPGPGYKWVRGREKKDGTRGAGHWAKDPHYKE